MSTATKPLELFRESTQDAILRDIKLMNLLHARGLPQIDAEIERECVALREDARSDVRKELLCMGMGLGGDVKPVPEVQDFLGVAFSHGRYGFHKDDTCANNWWRWAYLCSTDAKDAKGMAREEWWAQDMLIWGDAEKKALSKKRYPLALMHYAAHRFATSATTSSTTSPKEIVMDFSIVEMLCIAKDLCAISPTASVLPTILYCYAKLWPSISGGNLGVEACFRAGKRSQQLTALTFMGDAAKMGHATAMVEYGILLHAFDQEYEVPHFLGVDVDTRHDEALAELVKATELGHPVAASTTMAIMAGCKMCQVDAPTRQSMYAARVYKSDPEEAENARLRHASEARFNEMYGGFDGYADDDYAESMIKELELFDLVVA
jgi:TPR repeat protein